MTEAAPVSVGDRDVALENEILRVEVGSTAHGIGTGSDDVDLMGVYIETPQQLLGIAPAVGHYVSRTQPEGARSGPGDVDLTLYSLRKFLRLATAGNPTVLIVLYGAAVHASTPLGQRLRALAPAIVSRRAGYRFLGYLDGQRERLAGGGRQSRVPYRPELVDRYGYDVKYASHAVRLGLQGVELVTTGHLTLPMRDGDRALCRDVKQGRYSYSDALSIIDRTRQELVDVVEDGGVMRDNPDLHAVNAFAVSAHQEHWMRHYRQRYIEGTP